MHEGVVLETAQRRAAARINTLLHRHPELPLPPPPAALAAPVQLAVDAVSLTERALAERPELRAARARSPRRDRASGANISRLHAAGSYDPSGRRAAQPMWPGGERAQLGDAARARAGERSCARRRRAARPRCQATPCAVSIGCAKPITCRAGDRMLPVARDHLGPRAAFGGAEASS
jgi:hypothetical protein